MTFLSVHTVIDEENYHHAFVRCECSMKKLFPSAAALLYDGDLLYEATATVSPHYVPLRVFVQKSVPRYPWNMMQTWYWEPRRRGR